MKTKKAIIDAEKTETVKRLRALLRPGTTVYTILRHVSSSGMSRRISVVVIEKGRIRNIDFENGRILEISREWGLVPVHVAGETPAEFKRIDRREDQFLNGWFNRMAMHTVDLWRKYDLYRAPSIMVNGGQSV